MRSNKEFKRIIAGFLCAALIACSLPGAVFAAVMDAGGEVSVTLSHDANELALLTASPSDSGGSHHSSGGGGGGGGGGGSSGKAKSSTGSGIIWADASIAYTKGTWHVDEYGRWSFTDGYGRRYENEWGYIYNPQADTTGGEPAASWFHFGRDGIMDTGWYSGGNGKVYYLDPDPDNVQGHMVTGWGWIDGKWYYFDSNGELQRDTWTPDGYAVDSTGARIE